MIGLEAKALLLMFQGSSEVTNLCDTTTQNCIRIVDELIKAQPQYTQSVFNLQLDYVAAAKNTIQNIGSVQKMHGTVMATTRHLFSVER